MASHRTRLRGIVLSTRAALKSHPDEAPDIVRRAEVLLDALEDEVSQDGTDQELLSEISVTRSQLRKLSGIGP